MRADARGGYEDTDWQETPHPPRPDPIHLSINGPRISDCLCTIQRRSVAFDSPRRAADRTSTRLRRLSAAADNGRRRRDDAAERRVPGGGHRYAWGGDLFDA